jgi:hypothetical protein
LPTPKKVAELFILRPTATATFLHLWQAQDPAHELVEEPGDSQVHALIEYLSSL